MWVLRAVAVVCAVYGLWGSYLLVTRTIPTLLTKTITPEQVGAVAYHVMGSSLFLLGGLGLFWKRGWGRKLLLVWLPFDALIGSRRFAYGLAGRRVPDWDILLLAYLVYGGFWILVLAYLLHPRVKAVFTENGLAGLGGVEGMPPNTPTAPPSGADAKHTPQEGNDAEPAARGGEGD